jgi:RNA polymerase sigma-32 factor
MSFNDTAEAQRANRHYIRRAMAVPLLDAAHELDLARRWREQGDGAALHELVTAYMRLVVSMAGRFRHYGLPAGDLIQEGNIGLMQAATRFEPARQVRFATYATWWIRAAIQDFVLRNWSIVRTGTTAAQKTLFFNLRRLRAKIERGGEAPAGGGMSEAARAAVAQTLRVPLADVRAMESRLFATDRSLNATVSEDGEGDWQDFLADERPNPEEAVLEMRDGRTRARWLERALAELTPRERTIIAQRRLRDDEDSVTLESLGQTLGLSKERVRQIEHQAMQKLRARVVALAVDAGEMPPPSV